MKAKKSLEAKLREEQPEFVNEVQGLSLEQLDQRLAELAKSSETVFEAKEADEDLRNARDDANGHAAPYNDALKMIRMKSKYLVSLTKDKS